MPRSLSQGLDALAAEVLRTGLDDWVPLRAIEGMARRAGGGDDDARQLVLETIRQLTSAGLVQIGDVSDGGFFEWEESTEQALAEISGSGRLVQIDRASPAG